MVLSETVVICNIDHLTNVVNGIVDPRSNLPSPRREHPSSEQWICNESHSFDESSEWTYPKPMRRVNDTLHDNVDTTFEKPFIVSVSDY